MLSLLCANVIVFFLTLAVAVVDSLINGVARVVPVTPLTIGLWIVATVAVRQLLWGRRD